MAAEKAGDLPRSTDRAGELKNVDFMVKDSKRFADSGGWGYAVFEYDPATGSLPAGRLEEHAAAGQRCQVRRRLPHHREESRLRVHGVCEEVKRVDQDRRDFLEMGVMTFGGCSARQQPPSARRLTRAHSSFRHEADPRRAPECGIRRSRTPQTELPCCPAARLALRHSYLRRCRAPSCHDGYRVIVPYLRGYGTTRFSRATPCGTASRRHWPWMPRADGCTENSPRAIVAGCDWGARTADILAALWPERVKGLVAVSGYLIGSQAAGKVPLPPKAELQWWYQYYFATERGRPAMTSTAATSRDSSGRSPHPNGSSTTRPSIEAAAPSTTRTTSTS